MLIAFCRVQKEIFRMTDSMNFGPEWIRNLPSEGSTGGGTTGGTKYQLAEFRYGREEMLALFDKSSKPPPSLTNFKYLYSESALIPLALLPTSEEERSWQGRQNTLSGGPPRGRGGSLERGGRISRGRGYQYARSTTYDGDQSDWSPRKEYNQRPVSMENWRRARIGDQEDEGWRGVGLGRSTSHEKWVGRSTSWRGEGDTDDKSVPERSNRSGWNDTSRAPQSRKSWDTDDHLPEWATENPADGGGSFDDKGAFHGSDDEQLEKISTKREIGLQKSVSQQLISSKTLHHPLSSSKSSISLAKSEDSPGQEAQQNKEPEVVHKNDNESDTAIERNKSVPNIPEKIDKQDNQKERAKSEGPPKVNEKQSPTSNGPATDTTKNEDSDFERLQEDFVLKLMGDEEAPKPVPNSFEVSGVPPPPNLIQQVQIQDRWFYQDPQGQMQGPFSNLEMAEWYKAGYFSNQLKVRRHCDERFFMLGELIGMCGGNPFQSTMRFPVLKNDISKMPDTDMLQFQYLTQMAAYKQAQARIVQEPWSALTLQQQELAAQRLIMQQQQVTQDLPYMQQPRTANPLVQMISQLQQANKLPGQGLVDKPPQTIPSSLDPHMQIHLGNLLSMQNRLPSNNITNNLPAGIPTNLASSLPPESMSSSLPNLQAGLPNLQSALPNLPGGMPVVSIGGNINLSRPSSHGNVDQISGNQNNDPITNLLKQLQQQQKQQQQSQQIDSLWQQNQFSIPTPAVVTNHWQSQQNEIPSSMWDIKQNTTNNPSVVSVSTIESQLSKSKEQEHKVQPQQPQSQQTNTQKQKPEKETPKEELSASEKKKKKDQEEKQAKKEAEEKRKQEQRKQEAEKKLAEEKRKKEEERIKKEQEKAKKEAEDKRMRELEEKRRLKEQRKIEEEAKKRQEELKKLEEDRVKQELKEAEARKQAEEKRLQQEMIRNAKAAPWSQSSSTLGMSLAEIQKAEREKRAQEAAIQIQKLQEKEIQLQQLQQQQEKNAGIHLSWAKKPVEPRKVKSLAEIQAEEQERLAKQAAETRLQKEKEKEILPVINTSSGIWSNQNINWGNPSSNSHWSSSMGGFWDDSSNKQAVQKPSSVIKSNSTNSVNVASKQQQQQQKQPQQQQQSKAKTKKEDTNKTNHNSNNNNGSLDDFTNWCYKSLSNISSDIDIPTFVTFLREIESALDVREYCKLYLGESNATHQFATSFLEKRRSFRPKNNAQKDDMCSPAPAITPSLQHSTEFQEVKGKNKKNKKSKMLKVDSRILGFNVTSAPDRINVGDRDYGDNS